MVTIGMNYSVVEGKNAEFEQQFEAVLRALEGAAGHTLSKVYRDVHDGDSYLIVSEWSDEDAFRAFVKSDLFKQVTSFARREILREKPTHKVYKS